MSGIADTTREISKRPRSNKSKRANHAPDCKEIIRELLEENMKIGTMGSLSSGGDSAQAEPSKKKSRSAATLSPPEGDTRTLSPTAGIYVMPTNGKERLLQVLAKLTAKHTRGRGCNEKTIKLIELNSGTGGADRSNFIEVHPLQLVDHISANGIVNLSRSACGKEGKRNAKGAQKTVTVPDFLVMGKDKNNSVAIKRAFHYAPSSRDANDFFSKVDDFDTDDKLSFLAHLVEKLVSDDLNMNGTTEQESLSSLASAAKKVYDSECSAESKEDSEREDGEDDVDDNVSASDDSDDDSTGNVEAVPRLMRVLKHLVRRYNI